MKIAHENNIAGILEGKRNQTNSMISLSLPAKHLQKHNTKMRARNSFLNETKEINKNILQEEDVLRKSLHKLM